MTQYIDRRPRRKGSFTRRAFLVGGTVVGAGTILGVGFLSNVDTNGLEAMVRDDGSVQFTAWVEFRLNGDIVFSVPRTEMGQGIYTALPMLMAEEMEIDLSDPRIKVEFPDAPLPVYTNFTLALRERPEDQSGPFAWTKRKIFAMVGPIVTGGSTSIMDSFTPLRKAGASAREMMRLAASREWNIPLSEVRAEKGRILNADGSLSFDYAELAPKAALEKPPADPPLKPRSEWSRIGKSQKRLDLPAKVFGQANFGIDQVADDMLTATVIHAPSFGGKPVSVDDSAAKAVNGYVGFQTLDHGVAVVADTYYAASQAADAIKIAFDRPGFAPSGEDIRAMLKLAIDEGMQYDRRVEGDPTGLLAERTDLTMDYEVPYLAHATLEPMNATARITADKAEIWAPTQSPLFFRTAAQESPLKPREVVVHTTLAGGGFGRRSEGDLGFEVVKIASAYPGRLVKVVWSREEDMRQDVYRPAARARVKARLGSDGMPEAMDYHVAMQAIGPQFAKRNKLPISQGGPDEASKTEGAADDLPYAIDNFRSAAGDIEVPIPVGYWRSVGHSANGFMVESAIDEMAHAAKKDPFDYRQALSKDHERWGPIAETLRKASGWDTPLEAREGVRRGRGVAFCESFSSFVGQVAEVSVTEDGEVTVDRIVCVTDVGTVVNPNTVEAQMEGAIMYGLTAVYQGDISIENGAVVEGNFDSYEMLHIRHAPKIDVVLMDNDHAPGGAGEPGLPPVAAAVTNALFDATQTRVRRLPITHSGFSVA